MKSQCPDPIRHLTQELHVLQIIGFKYVTQQNFNNPVWKFRNNDKRVAQPPE